MSAPYGQPPAPPPGPSRPSRGGLDLGEILALAAAGLGLVSYICSFASSAFLVRVTFGLPLFVGAGLLAAATLLPNGRRMLVPAAVLAALGSLSLLVNVMSPFPGPPPLGADAGTPGILVIILVLGFLQAGTLVAAVFLDAGFIAPKAGGGLSRQQSKSAQPPPPQGQYPAGQHPPPSGQYQYPSGRYGPGQEPPGGYGRQGPAPQGQYGQSGPPPQGQYGLQRPPPQGQYGRQGQPGAPGAYGQYEQQAPDSSDQGTTQFGPPDPDERNEPEQQDLRRRYGPPEDRGSSGQS